MKNLQADPSGDGQHHEDEAFSQEDWAYGLAFLFTLLNIVFVLVILTIFLMMKYGAKIHLDRFQASSIALFIVIFLCKLYSNHQSLVSMSRDIITLVESSEKVHEKVKNFSSYIKELGISNMSSAMYFLVIHIFTFRM